MKSISIFIIALLLSVTPVLADDWIKCGHGIFAEVGDRTFEVIRKCGEPTDRQTVAITKSPSQETLREIWAYYRGKHDFLYTLIFEDGILVDVEKSGHSYKLR